MVKYTTEGSQGAGHYTHNTDVHDKVEGTQHIEKLAYSRNSISTASRRALTSNARKYLQPSSDMLTQPFNKWNRFNAACCFAFLYMSCH